VEDDMVDVMSLRRVFANEKIEAGLFVAADGVEGLELLRGGSVPSHRRLVLLDIDLPRMNGIEMLQEMRNDETLRTTPVVILTSSDQARDLASAYALNVAGYLVKPVAFPKFVEILTTLNRYWSLAEMP
jgi:CheY-like chemotaxis protein